MGYWDDVIQWVEEWRPVNYSVTEQEDFETVKQRAIRDFQHYLKLLDEGTEEGRQEVIRSFTFSKFYGEKLSYDEELHKLSKEIRGRLKQSSS
ncbi:TPA: hypothetical protein ACHU8D_002234 [Streptococcus suis]|uniref:hypothetical protein n=1 Tax=Streptococcus TaxID=1301 RepID=UPI000C1905E1|nr:hypothetical protein [Streptococcus suis]NQO75508.1 hypothetical protein [Streptococcus suis]HEL1603392.1 hypothetical protein [Streptococcus suis]HEL1612773.1 hypothetical protein [Streptococcus suis]